MNCRFPLGPLRLVSLIALSAIFGCTDDEAASPQSAAKTGPPPKVVVKKIGVESVPIIRDFVARTEAVETIDIQARVEAILIGLDFEEGKPVKEGDVLYRLDRSTFEADVAIAQANLAQAKASQQLAKEQVSVRAAEASLAQAKAKLTKAQQDVSRLRPLAEKDAVPRQDLDTALASELVAEAEVTAQEALLKNSTIQERVGILVADAEAASAQARLDLAKLDLEYCTISSPIDGLIGRTNINVGNLVGRGESTVLATVSTMDPIYVTFAISEEEYLELDNRAREKGAGDEAREANRKENPLDLILANGALYPEKGVVVTTERAVAIETGTLQVVARFPNPESRLRPGQFGRVRIRLNQIPDAILCPQRAVMEQQSAKTVLVVEEGDKVALRTIQIQERYGNDYIVSAGLEAGDRVIIEGQMKARPGSTVNPTDKPASSEPEQKSSQRQEGN